MALDDLCASLLAGGELLVDEEGNETNADNTDNAEDNHDTGLLGGPVLALGELHEGIASNDGVDGRHFED